MHILAGGGGGTQGQAKSSRCMPKGTVQCSSCACARLVIKDVLEEDKTRANVMNLQTTRGRVGLLFYLLPSWRFTRVGPSQAVSSLVPRKWDSITPNVAGGAGQGM